MPSPSGPRDAWEAFIRVRSSRVPSPAKPAIPHIGLVSLAGAAGQRGAVYGVAAMFRILLMNTIYHGVRKPGGCLDAACTKRGQDFLFECLNSDRYHNAKSFARSRSVRDTQT